MKKVFLTSAILSVLSFGALADAPSFNYVQIGYTDGFESGALDGVEIKGKFELSDSFYLNAAYENVGDTEAGIKFDVNQYTLGFGYKNHFSESSAFFAQVDLLNVKVKVDFPGFGSDSDTESGYQLGLGIRSKVLENLELSAAAHYIDVVESDTYASFGAVYGLTQSVAMYANIETDFDDSAYAIGVRFSF